MIVGAYTNLSHLFNKGERIFFSNLIFETWFRGNYRNRYKMLILNNRTVFYICTFAAKKELETTFLCSALCPHSPQNICFYLLSKSCNRRMLAILIEHIQLSYSAKSINNILPSRFLLSSQVVLHYFDSGQMIRELPSIYFPSPQISCIADSGRFRLSPYLFSIPSNMDSPLV